MRNNIIVLNGPPGVGKDTIADLIVENSPFFEHMRFKTPLYDDTAHYINVNLPTLKEWATDRDSKDIQIETDRGMMSPREALIHVSEDLVKPMFGNNHYGQLAAKQILLAEWNHNVVFSDGGFIDEILPLLGVCKKLWVMRLHRNDFTFAEDSRNYITSELIAENQNILVQDLQITDDQPLKAVNEIFQHLGFCTHL